MKFYHLKKENYKKMEWKNKKGVTFEICIYPEVASITDNNFDWRLSSAVLNEPGSFSLFPGYIRYLTLLENSEAQLKINDQVFVLNSNSILQFKGSDFVACTTLSSPSLDLNLMIRADEYIVHSAFFIEALFNISLAGGIHIFYPCNGEFKFIIKNNQITALKQNDTLLFTVDESEEVSIQINNIQTLSSSTQLPIKLIYFHLTKKI